MSNNYVKRTTLFKVPKKEDIEKVLRQYEILRKTAVRDGKPYIVSNISRRISNTDSPLSQGFTISSQSIFKNRDDHDFYDKECPAHKKLKEVTGPARRVTDNDPGIVTIVTEGEWPEPKL